MQQQEHKEDHGHSVAMWTAVVVILVGFALGCVFTAMGNVPLVIVACGLMLAGVIAGVVLAKAGYGNKLAQKQGPAPFADTPEGHDAHRTVGIH